MEGACGAQAAAAIKGTPLARGADDLLEVANEALSDFAAATALDSADDEGFVAGFAGPKVEAAGPVAEGHGAAGLVLDAQIASGDLGAGGGGVFAAADEDGVGLLLVLHDGEKAGELFGDFDFEEDVEVVVHLLDVDGVDVAEGPDGGAGGRGDFGRRWRGDGAGAFRLGFGELRLGYGGDGRRGGLLFAGFRLEVLPDGRRGVDRGRL